MHNYYYYISWLSAHCAITHCSRFSVYVSRLSKLGNQSINQFIINCAQWD